MKIHILCFLFFIHSSIHHPWRFYHTFSVFVPKSSQPSPIAYCAPGDVQARRPCCLLQCSRSRGRNLKATQPGRWERIFSHANGAGSFRERSPAAAGAERGLGLGRGAPRAGGRGQVGLGGTREAEMPPRSPRPARVNSPPAFRIPSALSSSPYICGQSASPAAFRDPTRTTPRRSGADN